MSLSAQAQIALRPYELAGVPASGAHEPIKSEVVALFTLIDSVLSAIGLSGGVGVIKAARSDLNADLAHAAGTLALVYADPLPSNNDFYLKNGTSGTGSWTKLNLLITPALAAQIAEILEAYESIDVDLAAAAAAATAAQASAVAAEASADDAQAAALIASGYANAAGLTKVFDTYALANAGLAGIAADAYIQVLIDETHSGMSTVYQKSGGVLVYKTSLYGLTQSVTSGDTTRAVSSDGVFLMRAALLALLAASSGTSLIGHTYGGTGAINYALQTLVRDQGVNVKAYGALGNDAANDMPKIDDALAVALNTGAPLLFPAGTYKMDCMGTSKFWDVTRINRGANRAIKIIGAGVGQSDLHFVNAPASGALTIRHATEHWLDLFIQDLTIAGVVNGPLLTLGGNLYVDFINMLNLTNVSIENSANHDDNEGLRLNGIAGGAIINSRSVAYANGLGDNKGTGVRSRNAQFIEWVGGSMGNAHRGIDFTDGFSTGWTVSSCTLENTDISVSHRSSSAGGHVFQQCQFTEVVEYAVSSEGMLNDKILAINNPNFAAAPSSPGAVLLDPVNYVGVRIQDRAGLTTPTLPASGVSLFNNKGRRVEVTFWGGTVSAYSVNGFNYTVINGNPITVVLLPSDAFAITYSAAPTMHWRNIG
ncbi:hypothetical protein [Asticcacaulis endophyticus]|uniref:Pectate lyase superfamily protein n=1 Tax=Asticcacaulis endophyticus TaxID=1395890 RepID=A0A918PSZ8_9CAUL|nr:hypothetical protein [Asticcacaulis endophyticus]GGZ21668.1 hypothetical protein GCM10011273_03050 [Asticcacaulis endophyticus]